MWLLSGMAAQGRLRWERPFCLTTKAVTRLGRVDERAPTSTPSRKRKKRKGNHQSARRHGRVAKSKINFIDTSGQGDFLVDTLVAISAVDSAVCVVSASDGVRVYTEKRPGKGQRARAAAPYLHQ